MDNHRVIYTIQDKSAKVNRSETEPPGLKEDSAHNDEELLEVRKGIFPIRALAFKECR